MAHPTWPLFDVAVRTPMVELRLATEAEWTDLVGNISPAIYERTGVMPFSRDWPSSPPSEAMQHRWRSLANWTADSWQFQATVFVDDRPVGVQGMWADRFGALRSVGTGSWLLPEAQGRGIGREMRIAILHLAFAGLGALEAKSQTRVGNAASNAISEALGYETTHRDHFLFGDERAEQFNMLMRRVDWEQHLLHRRDDITIDGLEPVLDWFIAPTRDA